MFKNYLITVQILIKISIRVIFTEYKLINLASNIISTKEYINCLPHTDKTIECKIL